MLNNCVILLKQPQKSSFQCVDVYIWLLATSLAAIAGYWQIYVAGIDIDGCRCLLELQASPKMRLDSSFCKIRLGLGYSLDYRPRNKLFYIWTYYNV